MKILQVIDSLDLGGAEVLLKDLAVRMNARDFEVEVYLLNGCDSHLKDEMRENGIRIFESAAGSVYSPVQIAALALHLRRHAYDLVHVHLFPAQLWASLAALLVRPAIPLVTTEHSTLNRRRRRIYRPLDNCTYKRYAAIACISRATATNLEEWMPGLKDRILVIPNGINVDFFDKATPCDDCQFPTIRPLILSIGRFERLKDHATLIKSLPYVPDAHLVLAGDGPLKTELSELAEATRVADRVHFLGKRADIARIIKTADVYVQSSLWEGFGIAAVEAMAGGLPVVASRVPGLSEVIGDAGLLFEPGNAKQLGITLDRLLHDDAGRNQIREKCLSRSRLFSIEKTAEAYLSLYSEIISRTRNQAALWT